jgi:hypothetical protein
MSYLVTKWTVCVLVVAASIGSASLSPAALLLNYQFESVDGAIPNQTTPDSAGTFAAGPSVNVLIGHGTNTPGTSYPQLVAGPVANASYKSLNPNSAIQLNSVSNGSANRTGVTIADASAGSLDAVFTAYSVAVWVHPRSTSTYRMIGGKFGGNGNRGWHLGSPTGTTNLDVFYFGAANDADNSSRRYALTNVLPLDTWTHIAFTFDGVNQVDAVYINGVSQSLTNTGTSAVVPTQLYAANSENFWVGNRGAIGGVTSWDGNLDDFRIYNHALSASEVNALLIRVPEPATWIIVAFAFTVTGRIRRGQ